jgi:hypothetical protein
MKQAFKTRWQASPPLFPPFPLLFLKLLFLTSFSSFFSQKVKRNEKILKLLSYTVVRA